MRHRLRLPPPLIRSGLRSCPSTAATIWSLHCWHRALRHQTNKMAVVARQDPVRLLPTGGSPSEGCVLVATPSRLIGWTTPIRRPARLLFPPPPPSSPE